MGSRTLRSAFGALVAVFALGLVPSAFGSVLIAHSTSNEKLSLVRLGGVTKALMKFKQGGGNREVLAWGAMNGRAHPTCGKFQKGLCGPPQVDMQHQRLSPTGHFAAQIHGRPNLCKKYTGPQLEFLIAGCDDPDGSHWALQKWVRLHPPCTRDDRGSTELRLSHWKGALPKLMIHQSWKKRKGVYYHHIWGTYTFAGVPIFGLNWTPTGVPTDGYGRVVYLSVWNPICGKGWRRLEGVLSKWYQGQLCRTTWLNAEKRMGSRYHALAMGMGVFPDIGSNTIDALPDVNWGVMQQAYDTLKKLSKKSKYCPPQPLRPPSLRLNEVGTGTTLLSGNDFVELVNDGPKPVSTKGYQVVYRGPHDPTDTVLATLPDFLLRPKATGKVYLLGGSEYTGPPSPNTTFTPDLAPDAGGVALRDPKGYIADSVGYGPGVTNGFIEQHAADAAPVALEEQSMSRIPNGNDTQDNQADFKVTPATPGATNHTGFDPGSSWARLAAAWRRLIH